MVSRKLTKAGLVRSDLGPLGLWSEGFSVYRVGNEPAVGISYAFPRVYTTSEANDAQDRMRQTISRIKEVLADSGYKLSKTGLYIMCEAP